MKNYLKMLQFLKGHEKLFVLSVVIMFVASFFEVFQFTMIVPMVDVVFNNKDIAVPNKLPGFIEGVISRLNAVEPTISLLVQLSLIFTGLILFKNLLVFGYQYMMSDVSQRVMRDIRYLLYNKIQSLSLDYFSKKRTGELVSRITHDVNVIENAVSYGLIDLFRQTFTIIFWIIMAFFIDSAAAILIFVLFPLIGIPMNSIGRKLKKISRGIQEKMADINSHLLETISGIQLVKAFGTEQYEVGRFKGENHAYYKLKMKSVKRMIVLSPLTEVIGSVFGALLIVWFGKKLMTAELSFGVFALFFASIMSIISPIKKLGNVNALIHQALAANDRIYDVLDAQPTVVEKPDAATLSELSRSIKIDHVSFQYDQESGPVLHDVSLEVKKGEIVAIVGPTGTGKTTLANLIPRFYDPTTGAVTMDGVNLKDVTFRSLRNQIGIVTQDSILFNDKVSANISYGRREATPDEIEAAARKAFAHGFIEKMSQGYDTFIGDRGFRLSGGEKQRISIARAILKDPPLLILDEATSQLDSESEKYIQEALDQLMKGRTVVAIAHRLSTIKKADKIIVLEHGRVIGTGSHDALLGSCALYKRLYDMQFSVEN